MQIADNMAVSIHYTLTNDDNEVISVQSASLF